MKRFAIQFKEQIAEVVDKNLFECDESGSETCKHCACREGCINNISSRLYAIFKTEVNKRAEGIVVYIWTDDDFEIFDLAEWMKGMFDE